MLETNCLWKWSDTRTGLKGAKKCSQCLKKTKNKQKNNQKDLDEAWKSIAQTNLKKKLQESLIAWKQKEMKRHL